MLKNSYVRMGLLLALALVAASIFTPPEQKISVVSAVALMFAAIFAAQWPPITSLILRRPQQTLAVGIGLTVVGLLAIPAVVLWFPEREKLLATGAHLPVVLGVTIAVLPRSLKATARFKAATPDQAEVAARQPFRPAGEAADALGMLSRERAALVRIVGPWTMLFCLLPLAFVDMTFWKPVIEKHLAFAALSLLGVLLLMLSLPLVAAIQWARHLATGRTPRPFDVPFGALWGVFWRLFFTGAILRVIDAASPWLKDHLPSAAPWVVDGLSGLVTLLVLVLASPFAMVFVAVALAAKDKSITTAMQAARSVGRRFYLGMLLILAPIIVLSWLEDLAPKASDLSVAQWAIYFGWALALFATVIVATTYLTRIYLRSPANLAASPSV